jgi:putative glycosyltransferase (TIGR04348 family)
MLRGPYRVILQTAWTGEPADVLIALHARRSAAAIRGFRERYPDRPIALVLTGTDLYRDIAKDATARESLRIADRLVVLQEDAVRHVPAEHRGKVTVIFQSAPALRPAPKARATLDVVVVGHLREEKDPGTLFRALDALPPELPVRVRHIGAPLDAALARAATTLARRDPRYRWSGALPHGLARAAIKRAHVLVHPSILEGGANVIVEAVVSGTAVIASRMSGNIGMLGADHPGLFPVGDARALAGLLARAASEPAFLKRLNRAGDRRKSLFRPAMEAAAVRRLVRGLRG